VKLSRANVFDAVADYDQAVALDPKNSDLYGDRGMARIRKGDLNGTLEDYEKALTLDPKNATVYFRRSLLKKARGDTDGAKADYDRAIALDPKLVPTPTPTPAAHDDEPAKPAASPAVTAPKP
jgi:Flp pilus assembly protein TadD